MKLLAPCELLEQLRRRGLLCRPGWPVPAADFGTVTGADLAVGSVTGERDGSDIGDLVPVPCALGTLAAVIAGWWATSGCRGASLLALSGGASGASESLDTEQACSTDSVLAAVRRLYGQQSGEWTSVDVPGGSTSDRLLEWRFFDWTIRLGHPNDPGRIEVELPLRRCGPHGLSRESAAVGGQTAGGQRGGGHRGSGHRGSRQRGAERGGATRASRLLTERVERLEVRAGAVLVHLVTSANSDGAALESPLRLPTTLEVSLVTIAATAGATPGRGEPGRGERAAGSIATPPRTSAHTAR